MRVWTIVKILVVLVVAVIVAGVVAILSIDPNDYKGEIVAAVEKETGRKLTIGSDIELSLGLTTSFGVKNVTLSNAAWGSRPEMLKVGELEAVVAVLPLITGAINIDRFVLKNADILIETDREGRSNLDFQPAGATAGAPAPAQAPAASGGGAGSLPSVNNVLIENATLTLIDGKAGKTTTVALARAALQADGLNDPLELNIAGRANLDGKDIDFALDGTAGTLAAFAAGNQPVPLDLVAKALGFEVSVDGTIADPAGGKGIDLKLAATAPGLGGLALVGGDGLPKAGPLDLKVALRGDSQAMAFSDLVLTLGKTDLRGAGRVALGGARPRLEADLKSDRIDLVELMPADAKGTGAPAPAAAPPAGTAGKPARVFPTDPLPLDGLKSADLKVSLAAAQIVTPSATLTDVNTTLGLDNGALAVKPLAFKLAGSAFDGEVGLNGRSAPAVLNVRLAAPAVDVEALLKEMAQVELIRGSAKVDIAVNGRGRSVAEIMGTLAGHSRVLVGKGEMKNESLGAVAGLAGALGDVLGKKEWIVMECLASDFEIAGGVAKSRINLIDTELLTVAGDGSVNLGQETLAMKVTPKTKTPDLSLAVPVNIGGTFLAPTITPDPLATVGKIGGILGGLAFPPAALLSLGEMGGSDSSCVKAASAPQQQQQQAPAQQAPANPVQGIGEGLKNLFGR
ncbi:MAG: AsmA family protein [Alphaproteobacteria bacterium]